MPRKPSKPQAKPLIGGLAGKVIGRVGAAAQKLPGAQRVQAQLDIAEQLLLNELKQRMERLDDGSRMLPPPGRYGGVHGASLPERLQALLEMSGEQSAEEAEQALHGLIMSQLLPDEARIIAALSDGSAFPMVNIGTGPRMGPLTQVEFQNLSTIGKTALVKLRDQVPLYLEHLQGLRLLKFGEELADQEMNYQLLETEPAVRDWQTSLAQSWSKAVRVQRRSLKLSSFGRRFWQACQIQLTTKPGGN